MPVENPPFTKLFSQTGCLLLLLTSSFLFFEELNLVGGFNPSEKYEFVSWDDAIPNTWKVIKVMFQTTNQKFFGRSMFNNGCFNMENHLHPSPNDHPVG
jgi:hypothetical protein